MAGPTPRRRVLVVEDDASIRELLRLHLDLAGFTIDEAEDGRTALDRARSASFDLLLLDVMLPGLDGVSVCRAIRNGGPNVDAPILMVSFHDADKDSQHLAVTVKAHKGGRQWATQHRDNSAGERRLARLAPLPRQSRPRAASHRPARHRHQPARPRRARTRTAR